MSLTDEHDLLLTDEDGAYCSRCDEKHWERTVGGDFADLCEQCQRITEGE